MIGAGWGDALQRVAELHWLRFLIWGALATVVGTALVVLGAARPGLNATLRHYGGALAATATLLLAGAGWAYATVTVPDAAAAMRFARLAWLCLGLWLGLSALGCAVAAVGWQVGRSHRARGAGLALATHGAALTFLQLVLLPVVSR